MRNTWKIFTRDLKRLLRVPASWVVIFGLLFLPAAYAWFNIYGFWDPYTNTRGLKVAVANEDKGADNSLLGKMNLGNEIVKKLKDNKQLGWDFMDKAEAMNCVESGTCYAAIVIPPDFSEKTSGLVTDAKDRPQLDYYVNEKANAVAPKITDVGASTVDNQVNSTFVSTASSVVSDILNKTNTSIENQSNATVDKTAKQLDKTEANLKQTREMIAELRNTLSTTKGKTDAAKEALKGLENAAQTAGEGLDSATSMLTKTQQGLNNFSANASNQLDSAADLFSQASNQATTNATKGLNGVLQASGQTQSALTQLQGVNTQTANVLEQLSKMETGLPNLDSTIKSTIADLQNKNNSVASLLAEAQSQNNSIANTANSAQDTINAFNTGSQGTLDAINQARTTLGTSALPKLNSGLSGLALAGSPLSASIHGESALAKQTDLVLTQVGEICDSTGSTLKSTDELLNTFIGKIDQANTDLKTLQNMNIMKELIGNNGTLDATRIADFMFSPTVLKQHTLYPVANYGSGMAPLFTSLSLWVGVFMLMVLIRLEVDPEGIEKLHATNTQTYMARFLLLALLAVMQALICSIGDLIVGIQCGNRFMFVLTAVLASLSYLSLAYSLSTTFMHVGKALVVAMVMVQIPGASGLYPIEMMPAFYRILYPFFPFTYTINAFRETIAGFYDGDWFKDILMLALFAALSFVVGIVVRPLMTNVNRLFAREIEDSDMLVSERVYTTRRRFNLTQVIQMLADQSGYRQQIEARGEKFAKLYPRLLRGALIAGIVVPVALAVTFSLTDGTKLVMLATWIVWILLIILFLMIVEYIRDSLARQRALGNLSNASLREILLAEGNKKNKRRFTLGEQAAADYATAARRQHKSTRKPQQTDAKKNTDTVTHNPDNDGQLGNTQPAVHGTDPASAPDPTPDEGSPQGKKADPEVQGIDDLDDFADTDDLNLNSILKKLQEKTNHHEGRHAQ